MAANETQKASPSYRLAVEDTDFLLRDELRALRFAMEYAKAELALRDWGVRSTVVVFGSARIPAPEEAVPGAPRAHLAPWYDKARAFARLVSLRGGALAPRERLRDNVIATGGSPGIMAAANRGAADAGAPSIGFNISLPHEQEPNAWSTPALTFRFHYFAMRKMHLAMRANALAVFPGGFGTFDELFNAAQTVRRHLRQQVVSQSSKIVQPTLRQTRGGSRCSKGVNELIVPNPKQTRRNIRKFADAPEATRKLSFKGQEYPGVLSALVAR